MKDERRIAPAVAWLGVVLLASASLPLTPAGESFVELWIRELRRGLLEGFGMLIGFGSPFLFGAGLGLAGFSAVPHRVARACVSVPIALMHAHLGLVAVVVVTRGDVFGGWLLFLGGWGSGLYYVLRNGQARAEDRELSLPWLARWGATLLTATAVWIFLQRLVGAVFGFGLEVILVVGAVLMFVSREPRSNVHVVA